MNEIVECVTNISEGRNPNTIAQISAAIESGTSTKLLHVDSGYDANRTVFTFIGDIKSLEHSVKKMFHVALDSIDMTSHHGKHPRIGAIDVCPFIPIKGITMESLSSWTHKLADNLSKDFSIPIYMYEESSRSNYRKSLESIRKGEYENLTSKLLDPLWKPDYGPVKGWDKTGATVLGARQFLLAYNINLKTTDIKIARSIAKRIRGSGYILNGQSFPGLFPSVKAIGWYIEEYGFVQVSTNLTDYLKCSLHTIYEACTKLAKDLGVEVIGSELIGLSPLEPLVTAANYYNPKAINDIHRIEIANNKLGLSSIKPFIPKDRIIEFML